VKAEEKISGPQSASGTKKRARKRRSKSGSGLKWVLIVCGGLLAVLFIALFGLSMAVKNWLHGDGFQKKILATAESRLKSEVTIDGLDWQDSSLYIGSLQAQGYRDSPIAHLDVDGVRSVFDGARDQAWQVPNVTLNQLSVEFSNDRLPQRSENALSTDPKAGLRSVPPFLQKWIPQRAEIGMVRIDATNLTVKNAAGEESFALRAVESASKPIVGSANGWRIQGRGGDLIISGQPEMRVEVMDLRWIGTELFVNSANLQFYDQAHLAVTGELSFGEESQMNLNLDLSNLDVGDVIEPEWQDRVTGTVVGQIDVDGTPGSVGTLTQSGSLELIGGVLKDLPVLKKISTYTKSPKFNPLVLQEASTDFERDGEKLILTNIVIESDGLTRLEGDMTLEGENILVGNFRLGVTPGTLSFIPGAERKIFIEPDGGFLWTDVQVVGTLSQPRENLSQRLVGAAIESMVEEAPGKALDSAKDIVKDPTGTVGDLIDQGGDALKGFVPFFK